MGLRCNILQRLFFISKLIFLVESGIFQTNLAQFSTNDSMKANEDVKDNYKNCPLIVNTKSGATSTQTCALLMYGNALITSINLCDNKTQNCPYFLSGGSFTAWINITLEHTLLVWLISGSYPQAQRPFKPLIEYPNFTLPIGTRENISLFFRGSSCKNQTKTYEMPSWKFNITSATLDVIPSSKSYTKNWNKPVIGAGGAGGILASFLIFCFLSFFLSRKHIFIPANDCLKQNVFSYKELCIATKGFSKSTKLGSNGFGTVYKGSLKGSDKDLIVVKHINYNSKHAESTFFAEVSCLTKIQHPNIVQLLGWCHEKGHSMLLVYEYMPNRSLNEWLHGSGNNNNCKVILPWKLRRTILESIARAINYLHTNCPQCILHRNIKSSNIILDAKFVAHLGDFGLAQLLDHKKQYKTTVAAGYLEYMAPELPHTEKATKESDVYSFGILMLEVVCGRRPLDSKAVELEELVLLYSVWQAHEAGTLLNMVDLRLFQTSQSLILEPTNGREYQLFSDPSSSCNTKEKDTSRMALNVEDDSIETKKTMIKNLLHLGLLCCLPNPKARPTMEQVIQTLEQIGNIDNVNYLIRNVKENSNKFFWTPMQSFKWALTWCMKPL